MMSIELVVFSIFHVGMTMLFIGIMCDRLNMFEKELKKTIKRRNKWVK